MRYLYFPGCTLSTKAKGFATSGEASAKALGVELVELSSWNCCGATFPLATDNLLALVAPTRVLLSAQREGGDLVTLCSICYHVLKRTNAFLEKEEEKREKINLFIEEEYQGRVRVLHLLEVLRDEIGFEALGQQVSRPLAGLKVAPYYGCLLLRPFQEIGLDDPEEPHILGDLLASLGCQVVDFSHKVECCGSYLSVNSSQVTEELSYSVLRSAQASGAEVVATSCPLCQFNLDYQQGGVATRHPGFTPFPVLYFTQLLGIALGLEAEGFGLTEHHVDPRPLLVGKGLI